MTISIAFDLIILAGVLGVLWLQWEAAQDRSRRRSDFYNLERTVNRQAALLDKLTVRLNGLEEAEFHRWMQRRS
ncbi:hypothetical protein O4H61_03410 [Roseovarius aestuarii]|nr:hypothetical protein [Roseovarius aestuarii]